MSNPLKHSLQEPDIESCNVSIHFVKITVKILNIGRPKIFNLSVCQMEQFGFTVQ